MRLLLLFLPQPHWDSYIGFSRLSNPPVTLPPRIEYLSSWLSVVVAEADRRTVQYGLQMPHFASRNIQHPLKPPPFPHFFLKILAHPNKCLTFAAPEPAKPLNDAQMSGSFFYMHMTERIPFGKHYTEEQNLITLLQSRGLSAQ